MSTILQKIEIDKYLAIKEKKFFLKNFLGLLSTDCTKEDKNPTDEKVIPILRKFMNNAYELLLLFQKSLELSGGESSVTYDSTMEKISKINAEINIIKQYLPEQLSEDEIISILDSRKGELISIPSIMNFFKTMYFGKYENKVLNEIAQKWLKK